MGRAPGRGPLADEHAARFSEPFQPRGDVDAVAVNPGLVVNDVPEVDADAEQHQAMLGHLLVSRRHDALDLGRACGRANHAGELGEDAVARSIDDAAAVPAHQRQDHGLVALEVAERSGLVLAHESAVTRDVGGKNGRKSALDRGVFVHHPVSDVIRTVAVRAAFIARVLRARSAAAIACSP